MFVVAGKWGRFWHGAAFLCPFRWNLHWKLLEFALEMGVNFHWKLVQFVLEIGCISSGKFGGDGGLLFEGDALLEKLDTEEMFCIY